MFVIADNRDPSAPVFLWKVSHGTTFITHKLSQAKKFTEPGPANELIKTLRPDPTFEVGIYKLGIIA